MRSIMHLRALAAALLAPLALSAAEAQQNNMRSVTLVQLDVIADRPAMVHRRAGSGDDRDVIALSPLATVDDLTRALRLLDALHARFGSSLPRDMAAAVRSESAPTRPDARTEDRRRVHGSFVSALKSSARRPVAGFGVVQALQISVPMR